MRVEKFNAIVEKRIEVIRSSLIEKAKEYATDGDRLHNFKAAGQIRSREPEDVLFGFLEKHLVSVIDIIEDIKAEKFDRLGLSDEKIKDCINYFILLEALIVERMDREEFVESLKPNLKAFFDPNRS